MAKKNVILELTASQHKLYQAFLAANQVINKTGGSLANVANQANRAGGAASGGLSKISGQAIAAGAAFAGVGTALQAITGFSQLLMDEVRKVRTFQRAASQAAIPFQEKLAIIGTQLPMKAGPKVMDLGDVTETLDFIQRAVLASSAPDKNKALDAILTSISSTVGMPMSKAVKIGIGFAEARKELDEETMKAAARMVTAGVDVHGTTFKQQTAITAAAGSASYISEPAKFYDMAGRLISASKGYDIGQRDVLAMAASAGSVSGDPHGPLTRTAIVNMLGQVPQVAATMIDASLMGKPWLEQWEAVKKNTKAQEYLLGVFSKKIGLTNADVRRLEKGGLLAPHDKGRAATRMWAQQFISGDDDTRAKVLFRAAQATIPTKEEAGTYWEDLHKKVWDRPQATALVLSYAAKDLTETMQKSEVTNAQQSAGVLADLAESLPGQLGIGTKIGQRYRSFKLLLQTATVNQQRDVLLTGIELFEDIANSLRADPVREQAFARGMFGGAGGFVPAFEAPRGLTEVERFKIENLMKFTDVMRERLKLEPEHVQKVTVVNDDTRVTPAEPSRAPAAAIGEQP